MTGDIPKSAVLVADDEPQLLALCGRVLGKRGYEVLTARSGDEAVRAVAARAGEVRAIVMDATISPAGAVPVYGEILKMLDDVTVIVTSGGDLEPPVRELLAAHGGVFLRKPFSPVALVRAIEDVEPRGEA